MLTSGLTFGLGIHLAHKPLPESNPALINSSAWFSSLVPTSCKRSSHLPYSGTYDIQFSAELLILAFNEEIV